MPMGTMYFCSRTWTVFAFWFLYPETLPVEALSRGSLVGDPPLNPWAIPTGRFWPVIDSSPENRVRLDGKNQCAESQGVCTPYPPGLTRPQSTKKEVPRGEEIIHSPESAAKAPVIVIPVETAVNPARCEIVGMNHPGQCHHRATWAQAVILCTPTQYLTLA